MAAPSFVHPPVVSAAPGLAASIASPSKAWFASMVGVVALATWLRTASLGVEGIWLDEVYSAAFANLGPLDIIVSTLRFDLHPPLFYLQLKLWSLFSPSETWLMLNPVFWGLATLGLVCLGVWQMTGSPRATLVAATLLASLGSEVFLASELRMYTLVSFLCVAGWMLAGAWGRHPSAARGAGLVALLAALAATHSSAMIPISSTIVYGALWRWRESGLRGLRQAGPVVLGTGLVLLPWLLNASARQVSHTHVPTPIMVVKTISSWLVGSETYTLPSPLDTLSGTGVLLVAIGLLWVGSPTVRFTLLSMFIWPVISVAGFSVTLYPLWLLRSMAFVMPFLCIAAAMAVRERVPDVMGPMSRAVLWLSLLLVTTGGTWAALKQSRTPHKFEYREVATMLARENIGREPIHIPTNTAYWGMVHYLKGPGWGSVLAVQDPVRPDDSDRWSRIYARLGPTWLARLGLTPTTRWLDTPAGPAWIGLSPLPDDVRARGFWLIDHMGFGKYVGGCGTASEVRRQYYRGLIVLHCGAATESGATRSSVDPAWPEPLPAPKDRSGQTHQRVTGETTASRGQRVTSTVTFS